MRNFLGLVLALIAIVIAVSVVVRDRIDTGDRDITRSPGTVVQTVDSYEPALEKDPPIPGPPDKAVQDFTAFLERLRTASRDSVASLVLHGDALHRAEQVFRGTVGVPEDIAIQLHRPFFTVDPEAIFALYSDLATLERGFGLFQQHCSQCHGPYGRGNGAATEQWYSGNLPRNFWYGKFKSRSTEYGTVPTDQDLYRTLTRGLYGSTMPSFRHLSEQDRWALVTLIKTLASFYDDYDEVVVNRFDPEEAGAESTLLDVGEPPPATVDSVSRGRILFIEQGCVSCHQRNKSQPVGLGIAEGDFANWRDEMNRPIQHSRNLTTRVFRGGAAPSDLFRIISGGPNIGPMPNYLALPEQDRWALVHYIQSVFKPDYPQAPKSVDALAKPPEKKAGSPTKENTDTGKKN